MLISLAVGVVMLASSFKMVIFRSVVTDNADCSAARNFERNVADCLEVLCRVSQTLNFPQDEALRRVSREFLSNAVSYRNFIKLKINHSLWHSSSRTENTRLSFLRRNDAKQHAAQLLLRVRETLYNLLQEPRSLGKR